MTFFDSQLCIQERLCEVCRAKEFGLAFRRKMNPDNPDFDCRCGNPWGFSDSTREELTAEVIIKKCSELTDDSEEGLLVRSLIAQNSDSLNRATLTDCGRGHHKAKICKLWNDYQQKKLAGEVRYE